MATASGVMGPKQTKGFFVALSSIVSTLQYSIAAGTGAGGSFVPGAVTTPYLTNIGAGAVLKDMGKTVVSSTRTFRKVQNTLASGPALPNVSTPLLGLPFYIELNTGQNLSSAGTQVAYLPGLM
jgi:hypothetical protein